MPLNRAMFWVSGLFSLLLGGLLSHFRHTVGFLDTVLGKPGAAGVVASLVLVTVCWCLLFLVLRWVAIASASNVVRMCQRLVEVQTVVTAHSQLQEQLKQVPNFEGSLLHRRVDLVVRRLADPNQSERAAMLVGGQSGVDAARSDSAYVLVRALVWALPALGFIGTAIEMAQAVGGLGGALSQTQGYNDLRNLLVGQVVPHLAGAFDITLFALSGSVACYLLVSLVHTREDRLMSDTDIVTLDLLARIRDDTGDHQPSRESAALSQDLTALAEQVKYLNMLLETRSDTGQPRPVVRFVEQIASAIGDMAGAVHEIREEMRADIVISRRPHGNKLIGGS